MSREEKLLEQLKSSDHQRAATTMLQLYGAELRAYLQVMLTDPELAEEAFAIFTEDLWRALPQFERRSSARTWLYRLAHNAGYRLVRSPHLRRARPLYSHELAEVVAQISRSETPMHRRTSVRGQVSELRQALLPEERELLVLRVDRALSWSEIATILEGEPYAASAAALRKRFERIKSKLRKLARERGLIS